MSFSLTEAADGKWIEVHVSGTMTTEVYEELISMTDAVIRRRGKVRVLVITCDFCGWDSGASWEGVEFDWRHFSHIDRLALVGDRRWEQGTSIFYRPFTHAKIRYFDPEDLEAARSWILIP
jgi:hypothetical protein